MKEVVVISGKGGTGKTTVVASFAALARDKVMVDCDVDAADLHLLLEPHVKETHEFYGGTCALIDADLCNGCGLCQDLCRFDAITDTGGEMRVDPTSCEGCGFCYNVCPLGAIQMKERMAGHWFLSGTRYGPLVHARLGVAQENSGKLVTQVRQEAKAVAEESGANLILSDGPPGIGCPVIASISGIDLALVVTEPTLSGIHDLDRIVSVCQHFGIPALVCVNKYDINLDNTDRIEENCRELGIDVISRIPFDEIVIKSLAAGSPVVEYSDGSVSTELVRVWKTLKERLGT